MLYKECTKCKNNLPLDIEFYKPRKSLKNGFNSSCRICENKFAVNKRKVRSIILAEIKTENPCQDCNQFYPSVAMHFDHVRGKKKFNIGYAISTDISWNRILDEIAKCDVICANCHSIRTWSRG